MTRPLNSADHLRRERGSVQLFMLGLGVAILMLGGISFDLWRLIGERRELAALADASAVAAVSAIDTGHFRETGKAQLDRDLVDLQISSVLVRQAPRVLEGLRRPQVTLDAAGCDVIVKFEREFDFALLDFGAASNIVMSATGCASISRGDPLRRAWRTLSRPGIGEVDACPEV